MRRVERHRFVPEEYLDQAYDDHPLPIGYGQTISQPYIVALMSEVLGVEAGDRVLEIGTGSGYQAAVLAEMGVDVYTVEIVPELASQAAQRLEELGYDNVQVLAGGWVFRLGGARPLRCHHRHRRPGPPAATPGKPACRRGPAGDSHRSGGDGANPVAVREGRRRAGGDQPGRRALRAFHPRFVRS